MKKDPCIFLGHILECCSRIDRFLEDVPRKKFLVNEEKQSAVIRQIEIIGEAVKNLPLALRRKHVDIPWRDIAGMRDKLLHCYFGVDLITVWKACKEDVPTLHRKVQKIMLELKER